MLSWILNSVGRHIASTLMHTDNAASAWKELEEWYNQGNGPLLYQIRYELTNLHQGSDSIVTYFNKLKTMWDRLDANSKVIVCICSAAKELKCEIETDRVIQFLLGLDESFMTIKSQILSMQEIPSIGKVYALVKQEEKQKINIREKVSTSTTTESAHWAKKTVEKDENSSERGRYTKSGKKLNTKYFCEHCNYYGHVKEKCWHLIRYPRRKMK